jgi:transposase
MKYVGIDLHKKTISVCVMDKERKVLQRRQLCCADMVRIDGFFGQLGEFQAAVEATASYEWLVQRLEPMARRVVLVHPKKLRVIAESVRKTDKIDAEVLAEFLVRDMLPRAYRPTSRQREHRALVRQRYSIQGRITSVRCRIRRILSNYNADRPDLFSGAGLEYLQAVSVSRADRLILDQLLEEWQQHRKRLACMDKELKSFAERAPVAEAEARAVLKSIPYFGPVTIDVVLAELGDVKRFRSQKQVAAYAGLAPKVRESAGKSKELSITKEGSPLLRWALVEAAWRLVGKTRRWGTIYERLKHRRGAKKAIVAVARRLLCVAVSMLQRGQRYHAAAA